MPAPVCWCWCVCWLASSVRSVSRSLPSSFGVVVSGQCFCPSRSPRRAGNCEGRGTPLPLRAVVASLAAAARGMAAEVASGGKSVPRVEPLMSSPWARGGRRAGHVHWRAADAFRSWRGGSHRSADLAGLIGDPVTWGRHLRQPGSTHWWLVHFARRHYRLAPGSDDAVGAEDPSLRQAQAVRRALAQGPERAEFSLGVMNATRISGLAAAGLGARWRGLGDALTGINRADTASVKSLERL